MIQVGDTVVCDEKAFGGGFKGAEAVVQHIFSNGVAKLVFTNPGDDQMAVREYGGSPGSSFNEYTKFLKKKVE